MSGIFTCNQPNAIAPQMNDIDSEGQSPKKRPPKNPRHYAIALLSRREWGATELRTRLIQRGVTPEIADDTLAFLQEYGLQSDERFAASRARGLSSRKGNRAIVQDLRQKGVEPELIEAEVADLDDENERACSAARRFEGKVLDAPLKAKIWRFLGARGFSGSAIKAAMLHLASYTGD